MGTKNALGSAVLITLCLVASIREFLYEAPTLNESHFDAENVLCSLLRMRHGSMEVQTPPSDRSCDMSHTEWLVILSTDASWPIIRTPLNSHLQSFPRFSGGRLLMASHNRGKQGRAHLQQATMRHGICPTENRVGPSDVAAASAAVAGCLLLYTLHDFFYQERACGSKQETWGTLMLGYGRRQALEGSTHWSGR